MRAERLQMNGTVEVVLRRLGDDGVMRVIERRLGANLITQYGDQYYGERASGIGSHALVSGMRLGTGTTAAARTGAGAAIVTYLTASQVALSTAIASSLESGARRIAYQAFWAPGVATNSAIAEVVLTNEDPLTNVAGAVGNTLSRFVFSPVINKQAGDDLTVVWTHDLLGA
jgi:hypothetical protein